MKKNIIFVLLGFIIMSCSGNYQDENSAKATLINLDSLISSSRDTFLFRKQKSIPLENVKNSYIKNIDGLKLNNDTIYILDKRNNSILLFNLEGDFLFKINKRGRGPGEYLAIMDFFINDNHIYLLDVKERFLIFNKKGEYINSIELPFRALHCEYISGSRVAFQDVSFEDKLKYSVGIYDLDKEEFVDIIEVIKNVNDENSPFRYRKHLFKSSGGIYFNNDYSNIIYKIKNEEIKPVFQFSSKTFPTMTEILYYNKNPLERQKIDYKRIFHLSDILENNDLITFSFFQNTAFRVIYNKEKDSFSCFKNTPRFMEENNGTFISLNRNIAKRKTSPETVPNPFVLLYTIK